ncbi:MAG: hypothetical protein R6V58_18055 [Planctomycetota bacterium]
MNQPILRKLRAFRTRVRTALAVEGLAWTAAALVGLIALSLLIDYHQRLSLAARLFSMAVGLAALGYVAYRALLSRLARPMDDERIALTVEDRFPALRDRLISSLQFAQALETGSTGRSDQSLAMMAAVAEDARSAVTPLDLGGTIDRGRLLKAVACAVVLWAGLVAYTIANPAVMSLWFRRNVLMMGVRWPQRTHFKVDYDDTVVEGGPLVVKAEASGIVPSSIEFRYEFEGIERAGEVTLGPVGGHGNVFRARLKDVSGPLRFRIAGGDAVTDWCRVGVVRRPAVTHFMVCVVSPDYVSRTDDPMERRDTEAWHRAPQRIRDVLPGSKIWIGAGTTKELSREKDVHKYGALVVRDGEDATRMTPLDPAAEDATAVHSLDFWFPEGIEGARFKEFWIGMFEADHDSDVSVRLRDRAGVSNHAAAAFELRLSKDREPKVRVEKVGIGEYITPRATIPLRIAARDDYAVQKVTIAYHSVLEGKEFGAGEKRVLRRDLRILKGGGIGAGYPASPRAYHRRAVQAFENKQYDRAEAFLATALDGLAVKPLDEGDPSAAAYADARRLLETVREKQGKSGDPEIEPPQPWRWPIEELELPEGSEFRFTVHAADYKNYRALNKEPNVGAANTIVLNVVSPEKLMARLIQRQMQQRQHFRRVYDRQLAQIQIEIEATQKYLAKGKLDAKQLKRFRSVEEVVHHSNQEIKDIERELSEVLQEMVNNRVGDRRDEQRLRDEIVARLRDLHETRMPRLAAGVNAAADSDDLKSRLPALVRQNDRIVKLMGIILENMKDLENYRRIVQDIKDVHRDQKKLKEEIRKEIEGMLSGALE